MAARETAASDGNVTAMKKKTSETAAGNGGTRSTSTRRASTSSVARPRARRTGTNPDASAAPSRAVALRTNGHPTQQEIAEAAYFRYLERGRSPGFEFDDWIAAERSLIERVEG
jgi:hypothetical protein